MTPPVTLWYRGASGCGGEACPDPTRYDRLVPDRRWNRADFELVIRSHKLSDTELAKLLPTRRPAEIRRLRQILHVYHSSERVLVPDDSMAAHLAQCQGELVCAKCDTCY
jgi:hypothetical protein